MLSTAGEHEGLLRAWAVDDERGDWSAMCAYYVPPGVQLLGWIHQDNVRPVVELTDDDGLASPGVVTAVPLLTQGAGTRRRNMPRLRESRMTRSHRPHPKCHETSWTIVSTMADDGAPVSKLPKSRWASSRTLWTASACSSVSHVVIE